MRTTKILLGAFTLTFLLGCICAQTTKKAVRAFEDLGVTAATELPRAAIAPPQPASKPLELETVAEVDSSVYDEKYPHKIKLLQTGESFHGDEVEAQNGEIWLGLFADEKGFELRPAKLKIKRVYDDIVDDRTKNKTGKSVSVGEGREPIFLLKNARRLTEGKVASFFRGVTWQEYMKNPEYSEFPGNEVLTDLKNGFVQIYETGGERYELKVFEAENKHGEKLLALALSGENRRQILHTVNAEHNPSVGTLYWAGDLDRDGKPDFFLELFEHDNVDNKVLFLSSEAGKEKLLEKAAYFWTTGC